MRAVAAGLGLQWGDDADYPSFVRSLSSRDPSALAFIHEAVTLFRGAGYVTLPAESRDDDAELHHNAIAAPYAHVTAPLRRLVDRYGLEVCRAVLAGEEVASWVLEVLPELPAIMSNGTRIANTLENRAIEAVEVLTLYGREGEVFDGVVVDRRKPKNGNQNGSTIGEDNINGGDTNGANVKAQAERGLVSIAEPALEVEVQASHIPVGERVKVRLVAIDDDLSAHFELVSG